MLRTNADVRNAYKKHFFCLIPPSLAAKYEF